MVQRIATGRVTRWVLVASAIGVALLAGVPIYNELVRRKSVDAPAAPTRATRCDPAVLASVESILAPPKFGPEPELDRLVAQLVQLGPNAINPLLALACGDANVPEFVPGSTDRSVHPRAIELRTHALEESLLRFTDEQFVPLAVEYGGGDAALDVKLVVVRLLGARKSDSALPAVWTTLEGVDPIHFRRAFVQQSIEPALTALLERDPLSIDGAEKHCRPELLPSLARAAGSVRSSKTIAWLAGQLGHDEMLDLTLLQELGRAGEGGRLAIPETALSRLRDSLTQSHDDRRRVAVVVGSGCVRRRRPRPDAVRAAWREDAVLNFTATADSFPSRA